MGAPDETTKPPYGSFATIETVLRRFQENGVPSRVDRSSLHGFSGTQISQVKQGLEALRLTSGDTPSPHLGALTNAIGTTKWSESLRPIVERAYEQILDGIDLDAATVNQIEERFRSAGLSGETVRKAIRFMLSAFDAAGIEYSNHLKPKKRGPQATGSRLSRRRPRRTSQADSQPPANVRDPDGMLVVTAPIPGKTNAQIMVPEDVTSDEWDYVDNFVRGYIKLREGRRGVPVE